MERSAYFSIYELYFLLDAFQGDLLLGLPSREELSVSSEELWESAKEALVEKGILDRDGQLTEAGFVLAEVLREYCLGHSLTVMNNVYIMRSATTNSSILIVDAQEGYQVLKLSPLSLLVFLQEKLPIFVRKAGAGEDSFLKQERPMTEELERLFSSDQAVVIQHYPIKQMAESRHRKDWLKQLLVVERDGDLLVYHVQEEQSYHYSQYYFLERLYTWLGIPFREEDFV